jgi:anaphase-promoting complex subunit 2
MLSEADIFSSVFAQASLFHTTPTPLSTPLIGGPALGQSFGGPSSPTKPPQHSSVAQLQVKKSLAWSAATRYLSLDGLTLDDLTTGSNHLVTRRRKTREIEEALALCMSIDTSDSISNEEWDLVGEQ